MLRITLSSKDCDTSWERESIYLYQTGITGTCRKNVWFQVAMCPAHIPAPTPQSPLIVFPGDGLESCHQPERSLPVAVRLPDYRHLIRLPNTELASRETTPSRGCCASNDTTYVFFVHCFLLFRENAFVL